MRSSHSPLGIMSEFVLCLLESCLVRSIVVGWSRMIEFEPKPPEEDVVGASRTVAAAWSGVGESGRDCVMPNDRAELAGVKADAAPIITEAATLSTLSD